MSKMNNAERQFHQRLLQERPTEEIATQKNISFADEVKVFWKMDFVMDDEVVDVKGKIYGATSLKAQLWELLGNKPLRIVRVLPNTGRPILLKMVTPDVSKILSFVARLLDNCLDLIADFDTQLPKNTLILLDLMENKIQKIKEKFRYQNS